MNAASSSPPQSAHSMPSSVMESAIATRAPVGLGVGAAVVGPGVGDGLGRGTGAAVGSIVDVGGNVS